MFGFPPDVLNWVTREASVGDDKIFYVKLLRSCTKTNKTVDGLYLCFPLKFFLFIQDLTIPLLWITSSEKMWMKKRGVMCVYTEDTK